jgi:hypothetical protein
MLSNTHTRCNVTHQFEPLFGHHLQQFLKHVWVTFLLCPLVWIPSNVNSFKVCHLFFIFATAFVSDKFQVEVINCYGTYNFFVLQARIPAACLVLSLVLLAIFGALTSLRDHLGLIAIMPVFFVLAWSMQYWPHGIHHGLGRFLQRLHVLYGSISEFVKKFL